MAAPGGASLQSAAGGEPYTRPKNHALTFVVFDPHRLRAEDAAAAPQLAEEDADDAAAADAADEPVMKKGFVAIYYGLLVPRLALPRPAPRLP